MSASKESWALVVAALKEEEVVVGLQPDEHLVKSHRDISS